MNHIAKFSLLVLALACTLSCVKREYDLSKGVDTSIDIKGDLKFPLGSSELITLSSIIQIPEGSSFQTDDQGRYFFEIDEKEDPIKMSYKLDPIILETKEDNLSYVNFEISTNELGEGASIPSGQEGQIISKSSSLNSEINLTIPSIPEQIKSIKKIGLNAAISIKLNAPSNTFVHIKIGTGTKIQFPDELKISRNNANADSSWEIKDNAIVVKKDMTLRSNSSPISFDFSLSEINFKEDTKLSEGPVNMSFPISADFLYSFKLGDYTRLPGLVKIEPIYKVNRSEIETAELSLYFSNIEELQVLPIEYYVHDKFPEFFTEGNICLDLYNPFVKINTQSSLPFDLGFGVSLSAREEDNTVKESVSIGTDKLVLKSNDTATYYISKRGGLAPEGGQDVIGDISSLLKNLPYKISFEVEQYQWPEDYFNIDLSKGLSASMSYAINIPLSLGKDFELSYDYTLNGLDISSLVNNPDFRFEISTLELKMDIENSLGMGLEITAYPIDKNGEEISGSEIVLGGGIVVNAAPVAMTNTSNGSFSISFQTKEAIEKFGGLVLHITGKGSAEAEGNQLASNQGFRFNNMSINLKSGK